MKNRIKILRKTLGLTQTAFGERLGVSDSTITSWEKVGPPPKSAIITICALFNVNRQWLEDNQGEMFLTKPITEPFDFAQAQGCNETISRLFARYCALPKDGKEAFEKIVDALLVEKTVAPTPTGSRIVVNNATSERGDAVINQTFGN